MRTHRSFRVSIKSFKTAYLNRFSILGLRNFEIDYYPFFSAIQFFARGNSHDLSERYLNYEKWRACSDVKGKNSSQMLISFIRDVPFMHE